MKNQSIYFPVNTITTAILLASVASYSVADTLSAPPQPTQLSDVYVTGKVKKTSRKTHDVTGLGKIIKNSERLNKEQVQGIRDLTRYDPGIAVVEQGRGATAGYSMRGVDKNRVALSVDNLPQIQSYSVLRSPANSGAINEIEYENIRSVEISKGASSAEYGSGSLGGAVGFTTKNAQDIIKAGKSWGLQAKTAYGGKTKQLTKSIAFAGEHNNADLLVIYTHRNGKALQAHRDLHRNYQVQTVGAYLNEYDFRGKQNELASSWFLLEDECPAFDCKPSAMVKPTTTRLLEQREEPEFSPEEEKAWQAQDHQVEKLNETNYTGSYRILPNPMQYKTDSWLLKLGYHLTPQHYINGVFEHTAQRYDIRDMTLTQYWSPLDPILVDAEKIDRLDKYALYRKNGDMRDGLAVPLFVGEERLGMGLKYSRTRFFDERHLKKRLGVGYTYESQGEKSWIDQLTLNADQQKISVASKLYSQNCAVYPTVDKGCRASEDKPWSYYESELNRYQETHNLIRLNLDKLLKGETIKHQFNVSLGLDLFKSALIRQDFLQESAIPMWELNYVNGANGYYDSPYRYRYLGTKIHQVQHCDFNGKTAGLTDCHTRAITGRNYFIGLRDHIAFGKYVDLGLGVRFDQTKMKSKDEWTGEGTYRNLSWNTGIVVKPTKFLALSYKLSSGFRVPSFQEMFGIRTTGYQKGRDDNAQYVSKLKAEKALNQELGATLRGNFGSLEVSYFKNRYRDLIASGEIAGETFSRGYHNIQNIKLKGINVLAKVDWNGITDYLPEGLFSQFGYSKIKPVSVENKAGYLYAASPLLDAIQPARYIAGIGYDSPDNLWGLQWIMTHSKAKSQDGLIGERAVGDRIKKIRATEKTTKSWRTFDLIGYVNIKESLTLRAGVYNLTNARYLTWESVRQSAIGALNQQNNVRDYARYAAPGRNYAFSMELKF